MTYMGHSEGCTCSECYVRRQQTAPAPVAQPVHEQQTIEIGGPSVPSAGRAPPIRIQFAGVTPGVQLREAVPLPSGVDWEQLDIVGAAHLKLGYGEREVVALLARFTWGARMLLAIWWDGEERVIKAHGVDESA